VLGHYRLVERIGQGGMGVVYRAHDEHLKRDVAIKVLPPGSVANETSRHRFRKEAMALAHLTHPNIATVSDFDTQEGVDFLVQELIPGTSLDQMLMAGPLSEKQAIDLGTQLCEGIAAAHSQGVIHRDIKPGNLRITPDGRLKILDFGLATVLRGAQENGEEDTTASVVQAPAPSGTLPYMAPEQLMNESLDARTDIWATGCVLYEMATGKRPFGGSGIALADAILHQAPMAPSHVNRKTSPELEAIILKCLEKNPALRYGSARDLGADLNRLTRTAPGAVLRVWRWPISIRAVVAAIILLAAAMSGFATWKYVFPMLSPKPPVVTSSGRKVVAVLYFKNMSQDPALDWLNGGLTEMMITNLGQVEGMEVLSTERIATIRKRLNIRPDQELPADVTPEVAREAAADAYVTGALVRLGPSRLRVDVHLQEVSTGKIVFTDKLESSDMNGIFSMVDSMTLQVAEHLLQPQIPGVAPNIEQVATSNVQAFRHYRACVDYHDKFEFAKAVRECEEATRLDPQFALAYLQLVLSHMKQGEEDEAIAVIAQLEPLQNRLSRIRRMELQYWKSILVLDFEGSILQLEAMLQESPHDQRARIELSVHVGWRDPDRAVAILRQGLILDPKDWGYWNQLAYAESVAGHESAALEACDRYEAAVGPNVANVWSDRGDVFYYFGRYDQAAVAYLKMRQLDPTFAGDGGAASLSSVYSAQGKVAEAERELRKHQRETKNADSFLQSQMLQDRGEPEAALVLIRKSIEEAMRKGRRTAALYTLYFFTNYSLVFGDLDSGIEFVRSQKLGGKELLLVSQLEAAAGRREAAAEALRQYVAANPYISSVAVEWAHNFNQILSASTRSDAITALKVPIQSLGAGHLMIGRARILAQDYAGAERSFRQAIMNNHIVGMHCLEHMGHFRLGETYEAMGKRDDAIREYQSFLSHYLNSHSRLPQIAQARAALRRLGA
jgi:serine/threonine protein kinase/tetratricopeptide (TPR) repeat protein